jgi:hypothetical protein
MCHNASRIIRHVDIVHRARRDLAVYYLGSITRLYPVATVPER